MRKKKIHQFLLVLFLLISQNIAVKYSQQKYLGVRKKQELNFDQDNNLAQLDSFQWFLSDDEYSDGDQRDWKEYKWTIYELKKIDMKDVFDKCDKLLDIVNQISAWEYFFQDPDNFIEKSVEDLKAFQEMTDEIMDARHEMLNQMEDIQDKFNQEEEVEKEEETEDNTSIFDIDIFNLNNGKQDSDQDTDKKKDDKKIKKIKKHQDNKKDKSSNNSEDSDQDQSEQEDKNQEDQQNSNDSDNNSNVTEFTQIVKELDPQIQISRNRMMELHNVLNNKGKEFKDILLNGPYGGGNDIETLYQDMTKIFEILYTRYEELEDLQTDYEAWEKDLSDLEENIGPHKDSCGL